MRFATVVGEASQLRDVKYVIVLDSDTAAAARRGARAGGDAGAPAQSPAPGPSGSAGWSRATRSCSRGWRSRWTARGARASHGLFAGEPGIDPYTRRRLGRLSGRVRGGLLRRQGHLRRRRHLQAAIGGKLSREPRPQPRPARGRARAGGPRQRRAAVRGLPVSVFGGGRRRHRWTRGDWQIMAWLRAACRATAKARRVSQPDLVAVAVEDRGQLAPQRGAGRHAGAARPRLGDAVDGRAGHAGGRWRSWSCRGCSSAAALLARRPGELTLRRHLREIFAGLGLQLAREPVRAGLSAPRRAGHTSARSCTHASRLMFTGRKLLEWRTASDAQRGAKTGPADIYTFMVVHADRRARSLVGLGLTQPRRCRGRRRWRAWLARAGAGVSPQPPRGPQRSRGSARRRGVPTRRCSSHLALLRDLHRRRG
jgi:hypothetical protein